MNKVCVIAGQSGYEIVKEFQKKDIDVFLICGKENESGWDIADKLLVIDLKNKDEILKKIKEYSNYLFLGTGHNLAIDIAKLSHSKGCIINFNVDIANLFKNKLRTHKYINELGYCTPLLHVIENENDMFTPKVFPVVLKSEEDSYKTEMVNGIDDFNIVKMNILKSGSNVIIEKFIDGFEVTISVKATISNVIACKSALDMKGINEKAVSILKGFDLKREENKSYSYNLKEDIKRKICHIVEDIISKSGFTGYPRFDIMIDHNDTIYILEINSIMVTALGGAHYPWEEVQINPAKDMVELFLAQIKES